MAIDQPQPPAWIPARLAERAGPVTRAWPECLMEAAELGLFMLSACVVTSVLEHPGSPLRQAFADPFLRRGLTGIAMGLTAIGIVYSPWGQQSGAHLNPAVTRTF